MTMHLPPENPFKIFTWYRQIDKKEFIIVDFQFDWDDPALPVIGVKMIEKYSSEIKIVALASFKALIAKHKLTKITEK